MVIALDPRFPLVWRTPYSVQLGTDPAIVTLDDVSPADERVLDALIAGAPRGALDLIARTAGSTPARVDELLDAVAPALRDPVPPSAGTVTIVGTGPTADRLAQTLAESGVRVLVAATAADAETAECDLAVAIGHFVLAPALHGVWLRRDTPHLPIVFTERTATIGPTIEPGLTACLTCIDLHRRDSDPSWPAIATQLWGRRAGGETALLATEAAAVASRVVLDRLAGLGGGGASIRIDATTGERVSSPVAMHPRCGCSTPGGSDWASEAHPAAADRPRPRRARAAAALA